MGQTIGGFYLCTLKKDVTLLRIPQKLVVTYIPSLELFFSLTPFRRHLLLTVGNGSGEWLNCPCVCMGVWTFSFPLCPPTKHPKDQLPLYTGWQVGPDFQWITYSVGIISCHTLVCYSMKMSSFSYSMKMSYTGPVDHVFQYDYTLADVCGWDYFLSSFCICISITTATSNQNETRSTLECYFSAD